MKLPSKFLTAITILVSVILSTTGCLKKVIPPPDVSQYGLTTTFAGNTALGATNPAYPARPFGIAIDAAGNIYVTDCGNNVVRKFTPGGQATTLAGSGTAGAANGKGAAASFNYPYGIAVDGSGNVYIADSGNNLIRKITPDGTVSTLAGSGATGSADGSATTASFGFPMALAVDANGNVYVADYYYDLIRKVTPNGDVTTIAGTGTYGSADGTGTLASFNHPQGIAIDKAGILYIADTDNYDIRILKPTGEVTTFAGTGAAGIINGTGTAASFGDPVGIAVDISGNLYVGDAINYVIRKITPAGVVTTLSGSSFPGSANGIGTAADFGLPDGLAVDKNYNVYVADYNNSSIRKIVAKE
jgi:sugar lactone lactonase YvrE